MGAGASQPAHRGTVRTHRPGRVRPSAGGRALPPARGRYTHAHTKTWAATVAKYDGYVFVTPEYNHTTSGVLKNAIDRVYGEWNNKAAAFVSYGHNGGVRAAEQLRLIMGALQIADVSAQVSLNLMTDFSNVSEFKPGDYQQTALTAMLDQLVNWGGALAPLRPYPGPAAA